jgi:hypothetical protein
VTGVTETGMQEKRCGAGDKGVGGNREVQGVQVPGAIAPCNHVPRQQILHRAIFLLITRFTMVLNGFSPVLRGFVV